MTAAQEDRGGDLTGARSGCRNIHLKTASFELTYFLTVFF
jgi:hypothetical protein